MAGVISNRFLATNWVSHSGWSAGVVSMLYARFSRDLATSDSLPSMPSTSLACVAIGNVKLPKPQNQSITRSSF